MQESVDRSRQRSCVHALVAMRHASVTVHLERSRALNGNWMGVVQKRATSRARFLIDRLLTRRLSWRKRLDSHESQPIQELLWQIVPMRRDR